MSFLSDKVICSESTGNTYKIIKVLGHGAFGEVLLAQDQAGQQHAVKQLYVRDHEKWLSLSVAREVAALKRLSHPNVVSLVDVVVIGPCCYLVQELCRTDLAEVLYATNQPLLPSVVTSIMKQLLQAITACHAAGLMHRDIKPSNILFTSSGIVKLADFGLARSYQPSTVNAVEQHEQQAVHGTNGSTPSWLQQQTQSLSPSQVSQQSLCKHTANQQHQGGQQQWLQQEHTFAVRSAAGALTQLHVSDSPGSSPAAAMATTAAAAAAVLETPWAQLHNEKTGCHTAAQGTRWYRAPELLYGSCSYGPAVDIWSAGMVFAELLGLAPLIPGQSDIDQLARMQQTLGTITLQDWPEVEQLPDWHKIRFGANAGIPLQQLLPNAPAAAVDLLGRMICYRPSQRITAAAALQHYYMTAAPEAASPGVLAETVQQLLQQAPPALPQFSVRW